MNIAILGPKYDYAVDAKATAATISADSDGTRNERAKAIVNDYRLLLKDRREDNRHHADSEGSRCGYRAYPPHSERHC